MINFQEMTDQQLVHLYKSNVNEAFDELLSRYKDKLYSYILYTTKDEYLADDLFQETFVKAIVHIRNGRYVDTGKIYAWLTRIAHNLIIDQYRTERSENTMSNDEAESDLFENASFSESLMDNDVIPEQTLEEVQNLVKKLPESQRAVVEMRYYKDMSFKEISNVTGVSINTALGRMRYAIMNMRKMANEGNLSLSLS